MSSLDSPLSASFTFDDVSAWPEGAVAVLQNSGILKRGRNAQAVTCDGCEEACIEDVEFSRDEDDGLVGYVICRRREHIGRVRIDSDRLRTWEVNCGNLAALISRELGLRSEEILPGRLWMVGLVEADNARTDVLLARGLRWPDGDRVLREARSRKQSRSDVLLLPTSGESDNSLEIVSLGEVLSLDGNRLAADVTVIRQAAERAQSAALSIVGSEGNIFRREGQRWCIVYAGKRISLNHSDGLTYIAYLLERPHTSLHVRELYAIAHPPDIQAQPNPYMKRNKEDLAEDDLHMDDGYSPTDRRDDADLFATYRKSLADLERERDEAQSNGNADKADELQTKLDDLKRLMAAEFGLDGSPRRPGDPNKQAYDRVSKAINAVKRRVQEHHQPLSAHLASIHYNTYTYTYSPEVPTDWET